MKKQAIRFTFMGLLSLFLAAILVSQLAPANLDARGKSPALPLTGEMTPDQLLAQDLALSDARVQNYTVGRRSEVFGIREVGMNFPASSRACAKAHCVQVEIYNFDEDAAVVAIVNLNTREVLDVFYQPGIHPGINKRLFDMGVDILLNSKELAERLGFQPDEMHLMPMEGDMPGTSCDGSHICYSATFRQRDRILWAAVDLTTGTLAGFVYTPIAFEDNVTPNETTGGCPAPGSIARGGWTMDYENTGTDSLRVYNVAYNGLAVATSIKLTEQHADYGSSGYVDSTGCGGGGGGFPIYPYGDTQIFDLLDESSNIIGFDIKQDFRMGSWGNSCNYRYEQHFLFYDDGSFRVAQGSYGKGCGTNAIYRAVIRIDIAVDGEADDTFSRWDGSQWEAIATENYLTPYTEAGHGPHYLTPENYSWKVEDGSGAGYYIVQDIGQFTMQNLAGVPPTHDADRGDSPFLYVVQHHASEGDGDLGAMGPCCNDNHVQGPQQFLDSEATYAQNIVIWYVPQMLTDITPSAYYCWTLSGEPNPLTYPCFSGPLFVPMQTEAPAVASFIYNSPVRVNQTVEFTNQSTGSEPITYTWDFGDGSPVSTDTNPTHVYTQQGIYQVTLTATNAAGTDTYTAPVFVNAYSPRPVRQPSNRPPKPGK